MTIFNNWAEPSSHFATEGRKVQTLMVMRQKIILRSNFLSNLKVKRFSQHKTIFYECINGKGASPERS
jgi:hypothetical protein